MRPIRVVAVGGLAQALECHGFQSVVLNAGAALYAPSFTSCQVQVFGGQDLLLAGHLKLCWFASHESVIMLDPVYQAL